jgi:hypothetical protein
MSASHPDKMENPEVRFETEDIRATPVLRFLVGLAITCVVVALLLVGFYRGMRSYVAGLQPPPPHMKFEEARKPAGPLLQERPLVDLAELKAQEDAVLTTYAWVDKARGVARIPVDEAMRLLAERGLPRTAPEPSPQPAAKGKTR